MFFVTFLGGNPMKKPMLAIVGGLGKVGMQIALELQRIFESFLFLDSRMATPGQISFLEYAFPGQWNAAEVDVCDKAAVAGLLKKYQVSVCIGAVPSFLQDKVSEAAAFYGGCDYFDLGASQECLDRQKKLDEIFRGNQKILMPFCGFDPGMLNMLLLSCVHHLDCEEIKAYVGGISKTKPGNRLAHHWTFNPESTLETYLGTVFAIQDGQLTTKEALDGYVNINIGARPYEAFFTNCGNKEVMERISKKAPHIKTCEIKTVRHIGHWDTARFLSENRFLDGDMLPIVSARLATSVPYAERDIAFLEIRFFKDGERQDVISWTEEGSRETTTAMQKATAKSAALTVILALGYSSSSSHPALSGFMMPEIFTSELLKLTPKEIIEDMRRIGLSISSTLP